MTSRARLTGLFTALSLTFLVQSGAGAQDSLPPAEFATQLERVTYRQLLRGLETDPTIIEALARGDFASAVEALSAAARAGTAPPNIALIRLQHACARIVQMQQTLDPERFDKLRAELPEERAARIIAVAEVQASHVAHAQAGCRAARFDLRAIEARLRQAADQGDPVSATELARFTNDPSRREALLVAASDKNYAPAQHALAQNRVVGVQRGLSTENVASIRILLKQAGQMLPIAKLDFANCVAVGCDGHPADAPTAAIFGIDAARDGEAGAFPAIMRMPWRARLKPEEIVAWQYFGNRLNEAGCSGNGYIGMAATFGRTFMQLEKGLKPDVLSAGQQLADRYWTDFGERAKREQMCD